MKHTLAWLSDPTIFAVNREKAHSDYKFFTDYHAGDIPSQGGLIQSLNGIWKFSYANNPGERIADFYKTDYPTEDFSDIQVPGHIQLQGWDRCQYVNIMYPWDGYEHLRPPQVSETDNPVGSYVTYFDIDDSWSDKEIYLSFQGVETAFYVWVNGCFVGYSEDSFTPSEFQITPYLTARNNKLAVEVYKRSTGCWLEDQDFWRFSGIFRDVYLYATPKVHVRDMKITADYLYKQGGGVLSVELDVVNAAKCSATVHFFLKTAAGAVVLEGNQPLSGDTVAFSATLEQVSPWSAECPYLYTLFVEIRDEHGTLIEVATEKVGFRTFELIDGIMCLNGKRILFKGVNRHEFNPYRGRSISEEDMLYDIRFMKQNNINAVRTCHYPNQSRWYQLCDEYGIYLIDETNLETHGTWAREWQAGEPFWNLPGSFPEWKAAVIDRATSMYQRDKNHPSVLIWSCGNESFCGDNIAAMADYFHQQDTRRLVHYEGVDQNRAYDHITDMESRMYLKPQDIETYLKQNTGKPYISCEYMHAMGNSLGGMSLYTDLEDKYDAYQGGFIWDYIDQAIYRTDDFGRTVLSYGGDFEDRSTDYNFCGNGIVYADRTPSPKVQEAKALYSNVKLHIENGVLTVENRNLFIDTASYLFKVTLEKEGTVLQTELHKLIIPAGEAASLSLDIKLPDEPGEYVYHTSALLDENTLWAMRGHEIAFAQEVIRVTAKETVTKPVKPARIVYGDYNIGVHGEAFSMLFDKKEGGIASLKYKGEEFITRTPKVSFWRAMTDNDNGAGFPTQASQWVLASRYAMYRADQLTTRETESALELTFVYTTPTIPAFSYQVIYTAFFDGRLGVKVEYPGVTGLPDMPVFAMDFKLKQRYHRFQYYGMGPEENYIDRAQGARLGVFSSTAEENVSKYLRPQECGNRTGVRYVTLADTAGVGIRFSHVDAPFEMSVLPYSTYELENALHPEDLPTSSYTWVRIAAKQMGVGGDDSWGAPVQEAYRITADQPMTLAFTVSPL